MLWRKAIGAASAAGGSSSPLTYQSFASATNDARNYTFTDMAIGADFTDRRLIIGVTYYGSNDAVTSVLVDSLSATQLVSVSNTGGNGRAYIYEIDNPQGTTVDVRVGLNSRPFGMSVGLWTVGGTVSTSGSTQSSESQSGATLNVTVPSGGFAIGLGSVQNGSDWTIGGDATKRYGVDTNSNEWVVGADTTGEGTQSFTFGQSTTGGIIQMAQAFSVS